MTENPKHAAGRAKPGTSCVPGTALYWQAYVHEVGAGKYGAFNWRGTNVIASIYTDAAKRHLDALLEGEWLDLEDGAPHAAHVMACMAVLIDAHEHKTLIDDTGEHAETLREVWERINDLRTGRGLHNQNPLSQRQDVVEAKHPSVDVPPELEITVHGEVWLVDQHELEAMRSWSEQKKHQYLTLRDRDEQMQPLSVWERAVLHSVQAEIWDKGPTNTCAS